jgi:phage virion morphogenesis protein
MLINDDVSTALLKLLASYSPVARRRKLRQIAVYLRQSNRKRIKKNVQPDGSTMDARKKGSKRMFPTMGRFLKNKVTAEKAETGFYNGAGMVADNHQYGRFIQSQQGGFDLPIRELLGLTEENKQTIIDILLAD